MGATSSNREAIGKAADGIGQIVAAPGNALIELATFGSPLERIKQDTRQGLSDVLYAPFRVAKHTALGVVKGSLKLLWAGIKNLPIFPVWQKERAEVSAASSSDLATLAKSPNLKAGSNPYEQEHSLAA